MKRNLSFIALTAGALLIGGAAWAVGGATPKKATRSFPDPSEWTIIPANGSATAQLPNTGVPACQQITFTLDDFEVADYYQDKVTVTYAGEPVPYSRYAAFDDDDPENKGFSFSPTMDSDGVVVRVNYQVFTKPGDLVITLAEGAFTNWDDEESPAFTYTRSYGKTLEKEVAVKQYKPAANSTVKTLSDIVLYFGIESLGEDMVLCDASKAELITLSKEGSDPVKATEVAFAEDEMGMVEESMPYTVTFPEITEAGEYTLSVPEGFFWASDDMSAPKADDAVANKAFSAKFIVDPNKKSPVENYSFLFPEDTPAGLPELSMIHLEFPEIQMLQFADEPEVSITKDGQPVDVTCNLGYCWEYGNMHTAQVYFTNDEDDDVTLTEPGTYELTIGAGAISDGAQGSPVIKKTFVVSGTSGTRDYTWKAVPAADSKLDLPSKEATNTEITFYVNGAEEISLEEWEDPNYKPTEGNVSRSITVTYRGQSVKQVANAAGTEDENIGWQLLGGWDDNDFRIRINNAVLERAGVLSIKIDEGMLTVDGDYPSPEINYTCTFGDTSSKKEYVTEVYPEWGGLDSEYLLSDFQEFKVVFVNAETAAPKMRRDYDDENKPVMVEDVNPHLAVGNVMYFGDYTVTEDKTAEHPTYIFKFTDLQDIDASHGGWLNFSLDEGSFILDGDQDSPVVTQTWTLKRTAEVDKSWLPSPTGDIVNNGYGIYANFQFNIEESVSVTSEFYQNVVVKFNDEVVPRVLSSSMAEEAEVAYWFEQNSTNTLIFNLVSTKFMDPELTGKVTVEIPAGGVTVAGEPLEAIEYTWNVVLPKEYSLKISPAFVLKGGDEEIGETDDLSEIIVEIPEAKTAKIHNLNYINLRSSDYFTFGAKAPKSAVEVEGAEHPTFKLTFDPAPTEETKYVLSFNYGAFYVDNAFDTKNLDFEINLKKSSGIRGVEGADNGAYTAVSIDGKVLFTNGSIEDVKKLDKGIYIINGKKTIIK